MTNQLLRTHFIERKTKRQKNTNLDNSKLSKQEADYALTPLIAARELIRSNKGDTHTYRRENYSFVR